jgi:hypothetical protein
MKIFFMTTHPAQGTGYALVANKITNFLASQPDVEVVFYGFKTIKTNRLSIDSLTPELNFMMPLK